MGEKPLNGVVEAIASDRVLQDFEMENYIEGNGGEDGVFGTME